MHELHLTAADKAARYAQILPQLRAIIEDESDTVANLANTAAVLKEAFGWLWVGFYRVVGDELVLSAFQGPLACTRIARGRGVCGQAWGQNRTLIVPDVNAHPDHIACSSRCVMRAARCGRCWTRTRKRLPCLTKPTRRGWRQSLSGFLRNMG